MSKANITPEKIDFQKLIEDSIYNKLMNWKTGLVIIAAIGFSIIVFLLFPIEESLFLNFPMLIVITSVIGILPLFSDETSKSAIALLVETDESWTDYTSLLVNIDELDKLKKRTSRRFKSQREKSFILTSPLLIIIPYILRNFPYQGLQWSMIVDIVLLLVVYMIAITIVSEFIVVRACIRYVDDILEEKKNNYLLENQRTLISRLVSGETEIRESSFQKRIELTHLGYLKKVTDLMRTSRTVVLGFSLYTSQILILFLLGMMANNDEISGFSILINIVEFLPIIFTLAVSIILPIWLYFDAEISLHGVLRESKENIISMYDFALSSIGEQIVFSETIAENTEKRIELIEQTIDYAKKLPTWSFDVKVAGPVWITLLSQITIIIWNYITSQMG